MGEDNDNNNVLGETDLAKSKKQEELEQEVSTLELNALNNAILSQTAGIKMGEVKQLNSLTIEGGMYNTAKITAK